MTRVSPNLRHCAMWALLLAAGVLRAQDGRLLATGGAMQIEGTAGGGITSWAVIAGLSTEGDSDISAGAAYLHTGDFSLAVVGLSYSWHNRFELSLAEQTLRLDGLRHAIDLRDQDLHQDVVGAKLRLAGDLIYDALPQFVLGVEYKVQRDFSIADALGAQTDHGLDVYLGVSRLLLDGPFHRNLLLSGSVRATRANQFGLLGFGGDQRSGYSLQLEGAAALFLDPHWALGMEYRQKPDNLLSATEDDAYDAFIGWFPCKRWSMVLAYAQLGSIANFDRQRGYYLSLSANF